MALGFSTIDNQTIVAFEDITGAALSSVLDFQNVNGEDYTQTLKAIARGSSSTRFSLYNSALGQIYISNAPGLPLVATVAVQISKDNANWDPAGSVAIAAAATMPQQLNGLLLAAFVLAGYRYARLNTTPYTSGTGKPILLLPRPLF